MIKKMNDRILKTYVFYASKKQDLKDAVRRHFNNERGAGTVEYAMVIAVVVIMIIAATAVMDGPVRRFFVDVIAKVKAESKV
jgi:Flp pilus assembly pilin Flp